MQRGRIQLHDPAVAREKSGSPSQTGILSRPVTHAPTAHSRRVGLHRDGLHRDGGGGTGCSPSLGVQTQHVEPIREHLQSWSPWSGLSQQNPHKRARQSGQLGPSRPSTPSPSPSKGPKNNPSPNALNSDRSQFRFPTFGKNSGTGHVGEKACDWPLGFPLQFGTALGTTWPAIKEPERSPQPSTIPAARTCATRSSTQHYPEPLHAHHRPRLPPCVLLSCWRN